VARTHAQKDWSALKSAYRRGEGSIAELAPKFGIAKSTAEKRCASEKWQVDRQDVRKRAEAKAVERDVESLAGMLARHKAMANLGLRLAHGKLQALAVLVEQNPLAVSEEVVDDLTKVIARMVPVERLAAGIDRIKPVKPVETADDDEIAFDIDLPPDDDEEAAPSAPAKK
jgi:hypothetical protein